MSEINEGLDIAIIGMAGKFPGADRIDRFWENLCNGVEAITYFSDEELLQAGVDPALLKDPNYVKSRCIISDEDKFDAYFFDYSPREIEIMDPQQRLFLEIAWTALEDAGYYAENYDGLIGLFGGVSMNSYLFSLIAAKQGMISSAEGYQLAISNDKDFLTTRVSYKLNLTGPSVDVQTACSTSLVAVHIACQNLLNYSCDIALAGGASITIPQKSGYYYQEGMILSKDGHCRAFDEKASGTISGSGVGVVVLKRLDEALQDGDHIYAKIKGSSYNNDGALRVGYTAPSVEGQAEVIANAQAVAGVDPETITYIEAHGTGTELGDPIEISALTQVFRAQTQKKNYCAVGSVKTNIGHLDAAAGVTSLIKTALAMQYKKIPPSLNFEKPNPKIDFANSPFYVNNKLLDWQTNGVPRRAGVSSFGIGGTNAHVVMEEAPAIHSQESRRSHHLLLLSAKTGSALDAQTKNLPDHLKNHPDMNLADVAFTLQVGRKPFNNRRILVCNSIDDAVNALEKRDPRRLLTSSLARGAGSPPLAFMFSGQGAQYVDMGLDLYKQEPVFKENVDECCQILKSHVGFDLGTLLYPDQDHAAESREKLNQTFITQPALFVIEYALAKQLMAWGIHPQVMVGHSIGEYVAAHLSGVFSLSDALQLVAARGQLMQKMPPGAMLSIPLDEMDVRQFLNDEISLAAINSKDSSVVSGPFAAIEQLEYELGAKSINYRKLHTSHAFHSVMMEPICDEFLQIVSNISLQPPEIPYLSNVSGTWITKEEATDPHYYVRHLRNTVRFSDNVHELLQDDQRILLEVGPGKALTTLAAGNSAFTLGRLALSTIRHPQEEHSDVAFLLTTLGRLWLNGVEIDWHEVYSGEKRLRVSLPTYPFERSRYWLADGMKTGSPAPVLQRTGKIPDMKQWFYLPSWKRVEIPENQLYLNDRKNGNLTWLIFLHEWEPGNQLAEHLRNSGQKVVVVTPGEEFIHSSDREFILNPHDSEHYRKLFKELQESNNVPEKIVHCWNVTPAGKQLSFAEWQALGFDSLIYTAQGIAKWNITTSIDLTVVSSHLFAVTGEEKLQTEKSMLLGPCRVIPQEYPHIRCKNIDLDLSETGLAGNDHFIDKLLTEINSSEEAVGVAFRGKFRWLQSYEKLPVGLEQEEATALRQNGVYLITGGLGRIGLQFAQFLAEQYQAQLALVDLPGFPGREEWPAWIETNGKDDKISLKISRINEMEKNGAQVLILPADIADEDQVKRIVKQTVERFGAINGVIHAAGLVGENAFRTIQELSPDDVRAQFRAKITGIQNLTGALSGQNPDFCLLQSSMSTVLGGLGFAAYAAANHFLDSFAQRQFLHQGNPWISVNWDGWNFDENISSDAGLGADQAELTVTPEEGVAAFKRIMSYRGLPQILVSTGDLQQRIEKWLRLGKKRNGDKLSGEAAPVSLHERPNLQTTYVAPETELQKKIVKVWQKILGIESIGIYDSFFDLGGNSLSGTQLVSQLRDTFKVELPLRSLFEDPTIASVATIIEEKRREQSGSEDKLAAIFGELDQLTDEEAKLLAERKKTSKE